MNQKTYPSMAAAVNDPASNASKAMALFRASRDAHRAKVDALVAQGMTREQAWAKVLA